MFLLSSNKKKQYFMCLKTTVYVEYMILLSKYEHFVANPCLAIPPGLNNQRSIGKEVCLTCILP